MNSLSNLCRLIAALIAVTLFLVGCSSTPSSNTVASSTTSDLVVKETGSGPGRHDREIILLNNCDGTAEAKQIAQRGQSVQISGGTQVGASGAVVNAAVDAHYAQGATTSKSLELSAPPGKRMEITIEWTMEEREGFVTKEGVAVDPALYHHFRPVDVQIVSQRDLGCPNGPITIPRTSNTQGQVATPVGKIPSPNTDGIMESADPLDQATTSAPPPTLKPSDTPPPPTAKPTNTPQPPTATPCPSGCILYQADWSNGFDGWSVTQDWKTINGMLVNGGKDEGWGTWIKAPYQPGQLKIVNYAVEAEMQAVREGGGGADCRATVSFGVVARATSEGAYWVGIGEPWSKPRAAAGPLRRAIAGCAEDLASGSYDIGTDWQTYRVEVQGNTVSLQINGMPVLQTTSNRYLEGGMVGLWSQGVELNVRSFKVIKL